MVKIGFLINSMAGGGAERVVSVLLKNLSRDNRKFYLILLEDKIYYDIPEDVEVIKLKARFFGASKLRRVVAEKGLNTVISFLGRSNYTNILARSAGHEVYISERINPSQMHAKGLIGLINRVLTKSLYKKANLIFTNSLGTMNSLNQDFGIDKEKIKVIYNPINLEKIQDICQNSLEPQYEKIFKNPVIINIGRLNRQKGQDNLIRSFKKVKEEVPEAKLVILGEGELKGRLKRLVKKLGLKNDVFFLGWQKNPFKFLARSNVFVLSSLWEGLPNTLIEALVCGVPAISTDCPSGPDEIIEDGKNGILVSLDDSEALAVAIIRVLTNPQLANHFVENGKRRAQDFSIKNIIDQYEKII